ncbi:MAG: ComF family protein [Chloroflexota bacterium]
MHFIDGIRSATFFDDNPIRPAIHQLKYNNHRAIVSTLSQILADTYQQLDLVATVLVPVPLHTSRFKERGYNQSELLADGLKSVLNVPVDANMVQRTRPTQTQMSLGVDERRRNVADAFSSSEASLADYNVLLIDDVCTTGATLDACAAVLKQKGVASVWGLTIARA